MLPQRTTCDIVEQARHTLYCTVSRGSNSHLLYQRRPVLIRHGRFIILNFIDTPGPVGCVLNELYLVCNAAQRTGSWGLTYGAVLFGMCFIHANQTYKINYSLGACSSVFDGAFEPPPFYIIPSLQAKISIEDSSPDFYVFFINYQLSPFASTPSPWFRP